VGHYGYNVSSMVINNKGAGSFQGMVQKSIILTANETFKYGLLKPYRALNLKVDFCIFTGCLYNRIK